ncbi:hypothetical protein [Leptospirillum ferriphilum]|uniref:hypothetical protein n=1 Tax=Leptospirillum ferriphilum TaxID=178606 RepID=UPI0005A1F5F0|nr:hypothetical protein [Leptospirillum ferriphilum]
MGLAAYMTGDNGRLETTYAFPAEIDNKCDWCQVDQESTLLLGSLWICPACYALAEKEWKEKKC